MNNHHMWKILLFSCLIIANSCINNGNKVIRGIKVSELLLDSSRQQKIKYCKLLKKATEGDQSSIKQITLIKFYDATSYDHGAVIVDLIEQVGEVFFIHSLDPLSPEQKIMVKSYIEAGLEYGRHQEGQQLMIDEVFPIINAYLVDPI